MLGEGLVGEALQPYPLGNKHTVCRRGVDLLPGSNVAVSGVPRCAVMQARMLRAVSCICSRTVPSPIAATAFESP
jgi:hypothetical protein